MAQTTVLSEGTNDATSTDIAVAPGASVIVGIFSADPAAILPIDARFEILQATPGVDNVIGILKYDQKSCVISGPGTFRVRRRAYAGGSFGVFLET